MKQLYNTMKDCLGGPLKLLSIGRLAKTVVRYLTSLAFSLTERSCYMLPYNSLPLATHGHPELAETARQRVMSDSGNGLGDFSW